MARNLASNTVIMFARTGVTMVISLYASRLVLSALGVTDFGIFALVAGIVSFFTFLNSSLSQGTQRFLSFELGRSDWHMAKIVFCTSFRIHLMIGFVILLLAETIGLWFVKTQATIPDERMTAALIVYQFSVVSTVILVVQVPLTAALTASERFTVFAIFDIVFALLRLVAAFLLVYVDSDKLILYGFLTLLFTFIVTLAKYVYCWLRIRFFCISGDFKADIFREILGFTGWSLIGTFSMVVNAQGAGVVLNVFFGPALNAAQSVALQVANAASTMGANLQIVSAPQIVKSFSAGDMEGFQDLIEKSSKFAFFIMLILGLPIIVEADFLFFLWLGNPPEFSVEIVQILLVNSIFTSLSLPLMTAAQASGDIRNYQIIVGSTMISSIPIGVIFLSIGAGPLSLFLTSFVATVVSFFLRIWILESLVNLDVTRYLRNTLYPVCLVSVATLLSTASLYFLTPDHSFWPLFSLFSVTVTTMAAVWFLGANEDERMWLIHAIKTKLTKSSKP